SVGTAPTAHPLTIQCPVEVLTGQWIGEWPRPATSAEVDGAGRLHAGLAHDLLDDFRGYRRLGRDHHERGLAARALTHIHVRDVEPGVAEHGRDPTDHAGAVVVVHDE